MLQGDPLEHNWQTSPHFLTHSARRWQKRGIANTEIHQMQFERNIMQILLRTAGRQDSLLS